MKTKYLLEKCNLVFPLKEVSPKFSGHHAIYLNDDGFIEILIWHSNQCWPVLIDSDEYQKLDDEKYCDSFLNDIRYELLNA